MQLIVAGAGADVGVVLAQFVNVSAGGVLTVRLTPTDAAEPALGVAVKVPAYVAAALPLVTVTMPQLELAAQAPVGPLIVMPASAEYAIELIAVWPVLLKLQLNVAAVGATVGEVLLQPVSDSAAAVFTVRFTATEPAEPEFGVAVSVPLYVPAAVPEVTVTDPQVAPPEQAPVGPATVAPGIVE